MARHWHILLSLLTLGLWLPAWWLLARSQVDGSRSDRLRGQTLAAGYSGLAAGLVGMAVLVIHTASYPSPQAIAVEGLGMRDDDETAASRPGPASFTPELIRATLEADVVGNDDPLPSGRFSQAVIVAEGTGVDYLTLARECASYMDENGPPEADGGQCLVFHSERAYRSSNPFRAAIESGEEGHSMLSNLCYVTHSWTFGGERFAIDMRNDFGWEGLGCPDLPPQEADAG